MIRSTMLELIRSTWLKFIRSTWFLLLRIYRLTFLHSSVIMRMTPSPTYHCLCASLFLLRMDLTSETNLSASNTGKRLSRAVSDGSLNQDLMGIALSRKLHFLKINLFFL